MDLHRGLPSVKESGQLPPGERGGVSTFVATAWLGSFDLLEIPSPAPLTPLTPLNSPANSIELDRI